MIRRPGPARVPLSERFWDKVDRSGDCWEWVGSKRNGYGQIGAGGTGATPLLAHRVAWELHHGPIPEGVLVLHRCDNPPCVRPAHLFLGTHRDNGMDMVRKGRAANQNTDKTNCAHGHVFDETNTYWYRGARYCRECKRIRKREYRRRAG